MVKIHLREVRVKKGISEGELARLSGVSKTSISEIENGRTTPTIETICKLAKGLRCSPCKLFSCD